MLLSYIIFTNVASVFTVVTSALDYLEADSLNVIIGWFSTFWVIILMLECLSIAVLLAFAWVQYAEHPGEPVGMELYTNMVYTLICANLFFIALCEVRNHSSLIYERI